jgi:hypothetical protein
MGNDRPIRVKCWIRFLESRGCKPNSQNSSHTKWKCPGCFQSIIFWGDKKEIPFAHITTNLQTMKVTKDDFRKWIEENC